LYNKKHASGDRSSTSKWLKCANEVPRDIGTGMIAQGRAAAATARAPR